MAIADEDAHDVPRHDLRKVAGPMTPPSISLRRATSAFIELRRSGRPPMMEDPGRVGCRDLGSGPRSA